MSNNNIILFSMASFFMSITFWGYSQEIIVDTEFGIRPASMDMDNNGDLLISAYENDTTWFWKSVIVKLTPEFDTTIRYIDDTLNYLFAPRILVTQNNLYIINAVERLQDSAYFDRLAITVFDEDLNMLSFKRYNISGLPGISAMMLQFIQNDDGRIFGFGTKLSPGDFWALEIDETGDTLRTKTIQTYQTPSTSDVMESHNDSIAFYSFGIGFDNSGKWKVFTVDTSFNITYNNIELDSGFNYIQDVRAEWLNDSIYMGVGFLPYGFVEKDLALYKANANKNHEPVGEQLHIYRPDNVDGPVNEIPTYVDPNYIYVGSYRGSDPGASYNGRYMVAIVDGNLNLVGMKSLGHDGYQYDMEVMQATDDLGCVVTGTVHDNENAPSYDWDMFIRKIMPDQIVEVAENTEDPYDSDYFIYPNPGTNQLNINTARKGVEIIISDIKGKIVLKQRLNNQFGNNIDTRTLPSGIYILHFEDNGGYRENIKWIKQ